MATSYTKNFNLGKQEEKTDKFSMDIINQNTDIIDDSLAKIAIKLDDTATLAEKLESEKANSDDIAELSEDVAATASAAALNRSTLGYQRKNLLSNIFTARTNNGVTFTVNSNGSITANGAAAGGNGTIQSDVKTLAAGHYILSGCPSNGSISTIRFTCFTKDWTALAIDTGSGADFTLAQDTEIRFTAAIMEGFSADNEIFYPMLRFDEITDDTYEPYQPSVQEQLTDIIARLTALEGGE